ncbi:hypothetical protein O6H91_13G098300 [Diphasiastrum complanatum]|uniref:Uncharacterized protein n=2 Tax=Diphasiastrum complanatum TaxID=34168 RepID=A0ACC2BXQ3_DIPCM|nr:hypothetical protein O6H91_13G098300 [Diphasiastrum complanatum]KAJ7534539.1 hypothetical protein O6H91_13G098300 [Diphasiastrum complanatum]
MGASNSREGNLDGSDSESEDSSSASEGSFHSASGGSNIRVSSNYKESGLDSKLNALSLNEKQPLPSQKVKLYHHIGGSTSKSKWVVAEKLAGWEFVKGGGDEDIEDERGDEAEEESWKLGPNVWVLKIGQRVRARVDQRLQVKFFDETLRVDFVFLGVWAMKFFSYEDYRDFSTEFNNCLFENTYHLEATEENKFKVFGKDFAAWMQPEVADESVWEEAEETLDKPKPEEVKETYNELLKGGIRSVTMGALDHSFLVSDSRIDAFRNTPSGLHGKSVSFQFQEDTSGSGGKSFLTPKKGMLVRGESNMMILSPAKEKTPQATGIHQLDIESGKMVAEWKFEKDGTPITMRDVTNESKSAQLDHTTSTFLGLDDNRLCRWDMRDRHGIVQELASPVLNWTEGHQFSRGTNFQCFATTGDGCVVVGSKDGKVRLYGTTSMRQAKTAFPGLGSPITHVDVTYDGKWILATTDTYMILISTAFKDKDGKTKTGFTGRMGSRIAAPRFMKLTPVDAYMAGKNHKFHGGQFSWVTESGKMERHLVVTVGNFTVIWDFRRVKQSDHECYRHSKGNKTCYCYKIVPKDESIIDSKFMHDKFNSPYSPEAPLVVATPRYISSFNVE